MPLLSFGRHSGLSSPLSSLLQLCAFTEPFPMLTLPPPNLRLDWKQPGDIYPTQQQREMKLLGIARWRVPPPTNPLSPEDLSLISTS